MEASFNALSVSTPKFLTYKDSEGQRHMFDLMSVDRIAPHYRDLGVDWSTVSFKPDEKGVVRDDLIIADSPEVLVDVLNGKPSLRVMQSYLPKMIEAVTQGRLEYIQGLESSYTSAKHAVEEDRIDYTTQKNELKKKENSLGWWTRRLLAAYESENVGEIDEFVMEVANLFTRGKFTDIDSVLEDRKTVARLAEEHASSAQNFEDISADVQTMGGLAGIAHIKSEILQELNMSDRERKFVIEGLFNHLSEGHKRKVAKSPDQALFSMDKADNLASYRLTADILKDNASNIDRQNANTNPAAPPVLRLGQEDRVLERPRVRRVVVERQEVEKTDPKPKRVTKLSASLIPRPTGLA